MMGKSIPFFLSFHKGFFLISDIRNNPTDKETNMEALSSIKVSIPIIQIVLLILCCTTALLFGRQKLALLINYLFVFYWGFGVNLEKQAALSPDMYVWFPGSYMIFGGVFIIFCIIGLLHRT